MHPESYKAVENLLELLAIDHLDEAAQEKLKQLAIADTAEKIGVGQETLKDIIADLLKPGRDLRMTLKHQSFVKMSWMSRTW